MTTAKADNAKAIDLGRLGAPVFLALDLIRHDFGILTPGLDFSLRKPFIMVSSNTGESVITGISLKLFYSRASWFTSLRRVEDAADVTQQFCPGERFHEQLEPRVEYAVMDDDIVRVA